MSLKMQVYKLIDDTARMCQGCPGSEPLQKVLGEMRDRLSAPLRVAVAGIMNAGKSTFMNALIGDNVVFTGNLETTYTVCWFKYAKEPFITVCFRDGETLRAEYNELAKWSVREYEKENPRINDVKYLIIHYPSEVLKRLEFIDTPGLNSVYGTDQQNTLDFLEIKSSEETIQETSMADAIIYAFSRSAGGYDEEQLKAFHQGGANQSTPINSVGILTKTDATGIWDITQDRTPVEAASSVADSIMNDVNMKRLVYATFPVCAKAVEGYSSLQEEDWDSLKKLAAVSRNELVDLLFDAEIFAVSDDDYFMEFGNPAVRSRLINALGQYGIMEICQQLSMGTDVNEMKQVLSQRCGITKVRDMLLSHFGNRTFLIKSQFIFNKLRDLSGKLCRTQRDNRRLVDVCEELENKIDELMTGIQTLNELRILQYYYNGQLDFVDDDESEDFMQVTGEYGREPEQRLGVESSVSMSELMRIAKEKTEKWHEKASSFMMPNTYVDAASTIARSYEHIYYYLSALCDE